MRPDRNEAGGAPPPVTADCVVEAGDWPDETHLLALAERALSAARTKVDIPGGEIGIVFTDDAHIRGLNAHWRGKDKATNVLSFPATTPGILRAGVSGTDGQPLLLGDIVVAVETVRGECAAEGKSFEDHLTHLLVHGFLHLLGYDHETDEEADEMEALERGILHRLAIADPYA